MTKEDITRMARDAGGHASGFGDRWIMYASGLERFASLVAAAEREACADFLMRGVDLAGLAGDPVMHKYTVELLVGLASAIRARRQE